MLMKWEDLEVGDVLRFKDDVVNHYSYSARDWVDDWCNKDWIIKYIRILSDEILIGFKNPYEHIFVIDENGCSPRRRGWTYEGVMFDIVSLKE